MDILLYQEKSPSVFRCLACSRRSHSGVRREANSLLREVREREKNMGGDHPVTVFFSAHISLRRPHDLNAWHSLSEVLWQMAVTRKLNGYTSTGNTAGII